MRQKHLIMLCLVAILSIGIISLYTTFAYDEEAALLEKTQADYNLIYSVKNLSDKKISLNAYEEKYVDVVLNNTYSSSLKYGMYYKLINTDAKVDVDVADDSLDSLQNVINPGERKIISLRVKNETGTKVDLIVGALVGFVQGNIEDLQKEGEILIK